MTKEEVKKTRDLDRKALKEFRGQWVAREGHQQVAADTLKEVLKAARDKGFKKPIVWQVPEKTSRYAFY